MTFKIFVSPHHQVHNTDAVPLLEGYTVLEMPARVERILAGLSRVTEVQKEKIKDLGVETIERVHPGHFIQFLKEAYEREITENPERKWVLAENFVPHVVRYKSEHFHIQKGYYLTDTFTQILPRTFEAAYWGAQTSANAAGALARGESSVFALVRPPGHHAYANQAGGFCFFNNAAVAARHLQSTSKFKRLAVLDVDFHHGNGTQEIFYRDGSVFFCSLHGHPSFAYPYVSGLDTETGEDEGEGSNLNVTLPKGTKDKEYLSALTKALSRIASFKPDALILSLGFDTAAGDPYGKFEVTPEGFTEIGREVKSLGLKTLVVQEGGYLIEKLAENAEAFFKGFLE